MEGEGVASPDVNIPGVLDLFTVVWSNPFGDITVEPDIKLFEFSDIQKYSTYNDGPESREFCRFFTSSSSRELDGFDSSIFWSTGFLWKHFRTCGVEAWDLQLKELVSHYKNWRAWSHEVHNLPGSSRKFSDNIYSGPGMASTSYSRRERENNNSSATTRKTSSSSPPPPPAKAVVAPPAGQTVVVPVTGQDGNVVHLQVSTVFPSKSPAQPRYKYINPSVPPPGYQDSWSSQVEDFLTRPRGSKRRLEEDSSTMVGRGKRNNFTAKAPVLPPSPSCWLNQLDTRTENKLFRGNILVRNKNMFIELKISVYHLNIGRIGEASLASSAAVRSPARSSSTVRTFCPGGRE